jgi:hypothetical protein
VSLIGQSRSEGVIPKAEVVAGTLDEGFSILRRVYCDANPESTLAPCVLPPAPIVIHSPGQPNNTQSPTSIAATTHTESSSATTETSSSAGSSNDLDEYRDLQDRLSSLVNAARVEIEIE